MRVFLVHSFIWSGNNKGNNTANKANNYGKDPENKCSGCIGQRTLLIKNVCGLLIVWFHLMMLTNCINVLANDQYSIKRIQENQDPVSGHKPIPDVDKAK